MTSFDRSMTRFAAFSSLRALRWLAVFAVLAAAAAPATADAATRTRRAAVVGAYDGIWNTVFATTRGNCSSGYSVPFTVRGRRVTSAGGGRVSGSINRGGGVAVSVSVGASPASGGGPLPRNSRAGAWGGLLFWHPWRRPWQGPPTWIRTRP